MILNTTFLIIALSLIIPTVSLPVPKVASGFSKLLFTTTLTQQKINQAVVAIIKFMIYSIYLTNNTGGESVCFKDIYNTVFYRFLDIHISHRFLPYLVDPTTLSNEYSLAYSIAYLIHI